MFGLATRLSLSRLTFRSANIQFRGQGHRHCLSSYSPLKLTPIRSLSVKAPAATEKKQLYVDKEGFVQVFKFPYAPHCALVARLKIYQTVIVAFGLAPYYYFTSTAVDDVEAVFALSGLALLVLFALGEVARRAVGIIYLHPERKEVKISHLTFFGGRQDTVVPLEDVIPVSETPENPDSTVWVAHFYGRQLASKLISTKFGGIKHKRYFTEIFGEEALKGAVFREDDALDEQDSR